MSPTKKKNECAIGGIKYTGKEMKGNPLLGFYCPVCNGPVVNNGNVFCNNWGNTTDDCFWAMSHYDPQDNPDEYWAEMLFGEFLLKCEKRFRERFPNFVFGGG